MVAPAESHVILVFQSVCGHKGKSGGWGGGEGRCGCGLEGVRSGEVGR